jgi:hypothetical protein
MPYDDPDTTDPMTLHGVAFDTESDEAVREMAECFVEEYIRSGFDSDRVLRMFKTQGYAGPFLAYQTLGEDSIRKMIEEQISLRNHHRAQPPSGLGADGRIGLPVLDS